MFRVLDEMSEMIYMIDMDTYDLLYINPAGRQLLGMRENAAGKCYRTIYGKDSPCEFCANHQLAENSFYSWEMTNPVVNRHFLLKDKIMELAGKKVRVEIAFDMTEQEEHRKSVCNALELQSVVTECAKRLYESDENKNAPDEMLEMAGSYLQAERADIFEFHDEKMSSTHAWCAKDIDIQAGNLLKNLPVSLIDRWRLPFQMQEHILIEDVELLKNSNPDEYLFFKAQNIHSMIAVPLLLHEELIGYVAVSNISLGMMQSAVPFLNSIGYFISAMIRQQRTVAMLEQLSYCDPLTGIKNRNAYISDLKKAFQAPVGVVSIDINGMKQINTMKGHQEGDQVLRSTAGAISTIFPDARCYRIGSDEFLVICENINQELFSGKVLQLRNYYKFRADYHVSLGMKWTEEFENISDVILDAGEAMFDDKKAFYRGRALSGRYRCQTDDILGVANPVILQKLLDTEQFKIYYQPQIDIQERKVTGAEALVRYEDPSGFLYPPDQFIPILEEARLISLLDFYVFERVCRQLREWMDGGGRVVPVSTNFSRHTLAVKDFARRLQSICRRYRIPQELLAVEITETVEADNRSLFYSAVKQLKESDFRISIDDFGVNNANLSLLTDIDFHILKIDRHVVENICSNQKSRLLISALVNICHQLEITLIAEGVETAEQLEILTNLDCDIAQGYLFARPMSTQDFSSNYLL